MENHESNGHDDAHAESGQTYSKGWWVPLVGLVAIALCFSLLGGFILRASGTDKWGVTEQCENGKCCNDPNCKGDKCKDEKKCDMKNEDGKNDANTKPADNK